MKGKLEKLMDNSSLINNLWIGTFHAICLKILSYHLDKIDYEPNFSIYDNEDARGVITEVLDKFKLREGVYNPDIFLNIIHKAKRELINPGEIAEKSNVEDGLYSYYEKADIIYGEYQKHLKANNAFDFNDLIKKAVELFKGYPHILGIYQRRFKYILIDEYQDTNYSQYLITRMLSAPQQNIFAVGDPDQNIFSFQGADISNILDFEKDYPQCETLRLERNYRSTKIIVRASQAVIENNLKRKEKTVWTENNKGLPLSIYRAYNPGSQAMFIVREIGRLKAQGFAYGDIAILYRSNYQVHPVEDEFIHASIPYKIVNKVNLWEKKEIKDILAYLRLAVNPRDSIALKRVLTIRKNGIGKKTIDKLTGNNTHINLSIDTKNIKGVGTRKVKAITEFREEILNKLKGIADANITLEKKILSILELVNYERYLEDNYDDYHKRITNIERFMKIANDYDKGNDIHNFLCDLSLSGDKDREGYNKNRVKLLTAHSSKGLEFPAVFIIGLEEGVFPHKKSMSTRDEIEAERRLFYVAMTRAERRLYLSYCQQKYIFGREIKMEPSRFLSEIPVQYLKTIKIA